MTTTETDPFFETMRKSAAEPLDPELAASIIHIPGIGKKIEHRLYIEVPYSPAMNGLINERFRAKSRRAKEALAARDWGLLFALYERPFRFEVILDYGTAMDDADYWPLLADCIQDTENLWQVKQFIPILLNPVHKDPAQRYLLMDEIERAKLAAMPESFPVYRGCRAHNRSGWSWTTDPDKARWFARRWDLPGLVLSGSVRRADVVAYWVGRNESEIFIDPRKVRGRTERAVGPRNPQPQD